MKKKLLKRINIYNLLYSIAYDIALILFPLMMIENFFNMFIFFNITKIILYILVCMSIFLQEFTFDEVKRLKDYYIKNNFKRRRIDFVKFLFLASLFLTIFYYIIK